MLQLHLRAEHLMVLASGRERDFRERLVQHMRESFAATLEQVDEAELERRVDLGISRARKHTFATERAIASFVSLMFVLGPRFDEHPKVKRALNNFARPDHERLGVLTRHLSEKDWQDVLRRSNATSWKTLS